MDYAKSVHGRHGSERQLAERLRLSAKVIMPGSRQKQILWKFTLTHFHAPHKYDNVRECMQSAEVTPVRERSLLSVRTKRGRDCTRMQKAPAPAFPPVSCTQARHRPHISVSPTLEGQSSNRSR